MFKKNESGQAIVILAVGLVVLLVFAALAIDGGNAYNAKREAQNAVDAAVMAGTRQLVIECAKQGLNPGPNESNILTRIQDMASANEADDSIEAYYTDDSGSRLSNSQVGTLGAIPCGCGAGTARGVEVSVTKDTASFLAGLMGNDSFSVKAEAKARYAPVANVTSGLYPFTRRNIDMTYNEVVTLRILDDADTLPGSFGWLTWDGAPNVPTLAASLTAPGNANEKYYNPGTPANGWTPDYNDKQIEVGKWAQAATGNMNSSQVRGLLDWHIANQTEMIIPLYDDVAEQGANGNYHVASFASFILQDYDLTGQTKSMTGYFIRWVANGDWAANVTCGEEGGLYSVKLTP